MNSVKPEYWDNASTTKVDQRVVEEMLPFFTQFYGNASSNHSFGKLAKDAVERSRRQVADFLNCFEDEIIFTSGATEAINLAIKGFWEANSDKGNHIITVKTEHKAVLATCEYLETKGCSVTYLDVNEFGLISLIDLKAAIRKDTILIAVMYVNNELGIIQPIEQIGQIAKANDITFFCDATQAVGKIKVDVVKDNIDMLCFSAHKLNGPKGVGVLFSKGDTDLIPLLHGGGQERGMRSGTYNTPLIVGLGKACELASNEYEKRIKEFNEVRKKIELFFEENKFGQVKFTEAPRVPNIISFEILQGKAEDFLIKNSRIFLASTGSACSAEIIQPSHVLKNIPGVDPEKIVRISI